MAKISIYKKLTTKEIASLSECSLRQADRIKRDIKLTFGIKLVKIGHYNAYYLI